LISFEQEKDSISPFLINGGENNIRANTRHFSKTFATESLNKQPPCLHPFTHAFGLILKAKRPSVFIVAFLKTARLMQTIPWW
jgi:hypothetical protein